VFSDNNDVAGIRYDDKTGANEAHVTRKSTNQQ